MSPGLDVTETGPGSVFVKGNHRLAGTHLVRYILGSTFGDTSAAGFGGFGHFIADSLREGSVLLRGYQHIEIFDTHSNTLNLNDEIVYVRTAAAPCRCSARTNCKSMKKSSE
jgi:hypothetical protein